ncbi:hypothetical protein THASP1DRAFT_22873 [Thamnocephalis sphaerospora]|uniref:Uncharacterized protein n=1 Tax=Thamnocephalis sphaerospora TaxID=78915 RepID=A0A4P9XSX6_9FUNG|nr:hypothetical protein THASP1DRAFT_22873 [Thamnocephalis sphaerospora]|eukprot:RKP09265.1 hypothetical protein THASP1DRAFT_22873 [Thamnocephalis sphaerospora]
MSKLAAETDELGSSSSSDMQLGQLANGTALLQDKEALEKLAERAVAQNKAPAGVSTAFYEQFQSMWKHLNSKAHQQQRPRLAAINVIARTATTGADCELVLPFVALWRRAPLPVTPWTTRAVLRQCSRQNRPDLALQLLADRELYGPQPKQEDMIELMEAFARQAARAAERDDTAAVELALDRMYTTFALCPYYQIAWSPLIYQHLVQAGAQVPSEEAWTRAVATAEEQRSADKLTRGTARAMQKGFAARQDAARAAEWEELCEAMASRPTKPAASRSP